MSDVVDAPVTEPVAPPDPAPPAEPPAPTGDDLEAGAVDIPEGDTLVKMVPLAAATTARQQAKEAREQAKALQAEIERLKGEWTQAQPYLDAAKAVLSAQPQAPPAPTGPTPEETAELEALARDLDFYKTDGTLDVERAARHQARIDKAAERKAQQMVGPLHQNAQIQAAQVQLNNAKSLKDPITGEQADSAILTSLWNKVAGQQGGLQTLANPEAAMIIWSQALNLTRWQKAQQGAPAGQPPAPALAPPVYVEPSGGGNPQAAPLSAMERKWLADSGMSEAEYMKQAQRAPR